MIDQTPDTDADTEVNVGDEVRIPWTLDAQVDPADVTFTIEGDSTVTASNGDLTEVDNGDGTYTYEYDHVLDRSGFTYIDYELDDGTNSVVGAGYILAEPRNK